MLVNVRVSELARECNEVPREVQKSVRKIERCSCGLHYLTLGRYVIKVLNTVTVP